MKEGKLLPKGKLFNIFMNTEWQRAWILPFKFCIANKIKEIHIKILHNIYPTNLNFSKFLDIGKKMQFLQ